MIKRCLSWFESQHNTKNTQDIFYSSLLKSNPSTSYFNIDDDLPGGKALY